MIWLCSSQTQWRSKGKLEHFSKPDISSICSSDHLGRYTFSGVGQVTHTRFILNSCYFFPRWSQEFFHCPHGPAGVGIVFWFCCLNLTNQLIWAPLWRGRKLCGSRALVVWASLLSNSFSLRCSMLIIAGGCLMASSLLLLLFFFFQLWFLLVWESDFFRPGRWLLLSDWFSFVSLLTTRLPSCRLTPTTPAILHWSIGLCIPVDLFGGFSLFLLIRIWWSTQGVSK